MTHDEGPRPVFLTGYANVVILPHRICAFFI